jgi:hypothetical protein
VIPRPLLVILVFAWPLLVVAFAVVLGAAALAQATQDLPGALVLRWIAMGLLMLAVVDLVLLVGVLGVRALGEPSDAAERSLPTRPTPLPGRPPEAEGLPLPDEDMTESD